MEPHALWTQRVVSAPMRAFRRQSDANCGTPARDRTADGALPTGEVKHGDTGLRQRHVAASDPGKCGCGLRGPICARTTDAAILIDPVPVDVGVVRHHPPRPAAGAQVDRALGLAVAVRTPAPLSAGMLCGQALEPRLDGGGRRGSAVRPDRPGSSPQGCNRVRSEHRRTGNRRRRRA